MCRWTLFFSICICLGLASCQETADEKLLYGNWSGASWVVEGLAGNIDASSAMFSFQENGEYTYQYADMTEKGKYDLRGNELHTFPSGGMEMMVKIRMLNADSLVFDMNRGGQAETLTLIRNNQ